MGGARRLWRNRAAMGGEGGQAMVEEPAPAELLDHRPVEDAALVSRPGPGRQYFGRSQAGPLLHLQVLGVEPEVQSLSGL